MSQLAMGVLLLIYVALGVQSFIAARKALELGALVFLARIEERRLHDGGGGAVTNRFHRHFHFDARADRVVRRVDGRERDQLLQRRRPRRRRGAADLAAALVDRHGDARGRGRRGRRQADGFVQLLHFGPVDFEADDLPRDAALHFLGERGAADERRPSSRSTSRPRPSSYGEYFCDSISALRLL